MLNLEIKVTLGVCVKLIRAGGGKCYSVENLYLIIPSLAEERDYSSSSLRVEAETEISE